MIKYGKYEIVNDSSLAKSINDTLTENMNEDEAKFFVNFIFKNFTSYALVYDNMHIGLAVLQSITKEEANINIIIDNNDDNITPTYVFFLKMFIDYLFKKKHFIKISMLLTGDDNIDEKVLYQIGFSKGMEAFDSSFIFNITPDKFYFLRNYNDLLFDADDTILDFSKAEEKAISLSLKKYNIEPTRNIITLYHLINIEHWKMVELKTITRNECLIKRFEVLFNKLNVEIDPEKFEDTYRKNLDKCHYVLGNARNVLNKLELEYSLYIISNGILKTQNKRMNDANLIHYFKDMFISENIGVNKPDIKFYEYVKNHVDNFDSTKAIVIGDSLTSDIKLANNANIASIWLNTNNVDNNSNDIIPTYVIYSLDELIFAY